MVMELLMPTLEWDTEAKLVRWAKKEGDKFFKGDVLFEAESDRATWEICADKEGILALILVQEGTESVAVNTPVALLYEEDEMPILRDKSINNGSI